MALRVVPNETVPRSVYRYLWPAERRVITVRKHPGAYVAHAFLLAAVLAVSCLDAAAVIRRNWLVLALLVILFAVLSFSLGRRVYRGTETYLCVTSRRIILLGWRRGHELEIIPISAAAEMIFCCTPLGRIMGYGTFIIPAAEGRKPQCRLTYLPYPEQLYIEVCGILFPDPGLDFPAPAGPGGAGFAGPDGPGFAAPAGPG
jgi:hypothetical protein